MTAPTTHAIAAIIAANAKPFRIDTKATESARATRLRLRAEGRAAYAGQEFAPTPPYPPNTQAYHEWLHGWWSVHYGYYCAACSEKHSVQDCPAIRAVLFADPPPPEPNPLGDEEGDTCPD